MNNTKLGLEVEQSTQIVPEVDETQNLNELVANVPKEIKIKNKVINIESKTPNQFTRIERVRQGLEGARRRRESHTMVIESQKQKILTEIGEEGTPAERLEELWSLFEGVQAKELTDEHINEQSKLADNIMAQVVEVLYHIVNADVDKPRIDRVWIEENINIEDAQLIIDRYAEKNSLDNFFSSLQGLRTF